MFAIALGLTKLETITVAVSSFIFIGAFTWVSIKGDLRKFTTKSTIKSLKKVYA